MSKLFEDLIDSFTTMGTTPWGHHQFREFMSSAGVRAVTVRDCLSQASTDHLSTALQERVEGLTAKADELAGEIAEVYARADTEVRGNEQ